MATSPSAQHEQCSTLDAIVSQVEDISTLPQVALRIMEVANDPDSGAGDVKEVLETDASLSSRVLRCVNSSQYATRGKITNLQQAIAYLGMQQIRNLAITASVNKMFASTEKIGPYYRAGLWRHMVAVGVCSRMIAMRLKLKDFEDVFLAGLLHDIGIVLEDQHVHEQFCDILGSLEEGKTLVAIEQAHLGFDHAALGSRVAKGWLFPDGVIAAIQHHHNVAGFKGEQINVVRCVELANFICSLKKMPSIGVNLVDFPRATITDLSMSKEDVIVLAEDLDEELAKNKHLLQI